MTKITDIQQGTVFERRISRREALALIGAMAASVPLQGCVYPQAPDDSADQFQPGWPGLEPDPVQAAGYGTDPVLVNPQPVPWPSTLTDKQLQLLARLSEAICPGSVEQGVPEALDEWISAPYEQQRSDRLTLLNGLEWLDRYSEKRLDVPLQQMDEPQLLTELKQLDQSSPLPEVSEFLDRLRILVAGLYFSSPAGVAEIGYQGNVAVTGDYPGPSDEAAEHLELMLRRLGLQLPESVKY